MSNWHKKQHKGIWLIAAALALVPSTTWALSQQFDLVCKGQTIQTPHDVPDDERLSIDLDRMVFCYREDGCKVAVDIRTVSPSEIVLRNEHNARLDFDYDINRTDGSYHNSYSTNTIKLVSYGTCQVAPFTGMPADKF